MSNLFKQALAALKQTKNLDTALAGSGFLEEGTYTFVVQAVDSSELDNNRLSVTYVTPEGQTFTDRGFFANKDGSGISQNVRNLISGCVASAEPFRKILDALDEDSHALEMLTGMRFQATLKRSPGFYVHATATGGYAAYDGANAETAKKLTEDFSEIKDARDAAKAANFKQSFVRIANVKATDLDANIAALEKALASRQQKPTTRVTRAI